MQRNDICVMGLVAVLCVNTLAACSDAARSASPDPEDKGATNPQNGLPAVPLGPITTIVHDVTTAEDSPVTFNSPALTDINTENVALVVKSFQRPAHGRVVASDDGSYIYTPEANYNGADAFVYTVTDGRSHEAQGTVNISVTAMNDAPAAMADSATTPRNTNLLLAATQVLANDSDIDGDALAIATVTNGSKGAVTLNTDGSMTYAPHTNAIGTDSFTYTTRDGHGGVSAAASVAVNIQPGWGAAESLESLFPGAITPVLISMTTDHAGGTTVFWTETGSGGLTELWAKQIDITSREWVKAKRLSSPGAGVRAESPHVVVDKFGATTVLWGEVAGGVYQTWLNRLESGVWGNASNVLADVILGGFGEPSGKSIGSNTHLLADQREKGAFRVVWDSGRGVFPYMLAGSGFSPAKGWAPFDGFSHSDSSDRLTWPTYQTAIDSNGDVTVVYVATYNIPNRQGQYAEVLRSAHFVNGKWLTTTDAFGATVSEVKHVDGVASGKLGLSSAQFFPNFRNLAVDQNNVVTAIWSQSNMIYANRYDPKARLWGTPWKISEGNVDALGVPLTSVSATPGMVVDKVGNVTAIWLEAPYPIGRHQMWSNRYESQFGTWRKLQRINDKLPGYAYGQPLLAVDDSGAVTAAWVQVDGVNQSIWFNRNEDGTWLGEKLVHSGEPNTEYLLDKIQQHKNGTVTIIWRARAASDPATLWVSLFEKGVWTTKKLATHPDPAEPLSRAFIIEKLIEDGLGSMTLVFREYGVIGTTLVYKNWLVDFR